jgi:replicative DNA helicase
VVRQAKTLPEKSAKTVDVEAQLADRKLPHNIEAEQSVLGALLVDVEAATVVFQLLTAEDFYSARHAKVFETFRTVYERHSTIDEVMAFEEMNQQGICESVGGMEFLAELVQRVPTAANAEYYARIVSEKAMLRALVSSCHEIVQRVFESDATAREQLDTAEQRVLEVGERDIGRDFVEIGQIIDDHFEKLDQKNSDEDTVYTGYHELDRLTTGFHPSEFIIVAGRPSMGKTSFCLNVVQHAAVAGKRIAIFSLEVSKDQLVQNLLCGFSRVDAHRLRQRSLSNSQWQDLIEGASRLRQTKIHVDDTPGLTPLALKAKARRLHSRAPLDMIVVDYLQLMEMGGSESRQQEISAVSRALKALGRELSLPVITISQLSRGVETREDHRPRLSDLRESGAIEQDADLVLLLYRPEYYKPENEELKGKAEVIIAKQRHGPTDRVDLAFIGKHMRFENMAQREEEAFDL